MKYCSKCGTELKDDAMFCKKCGYKFEEKKNIYENTAQNQEDKTPNSSVVIQNSESESKSKVMPIVCGACIIGILALAGISMFLNNERNAWRDMYYEQYDNNSSLKDEITLAEETIDIGNEYITTLENENSKLREKSDFFDENAGIILNDGSSVYHTYDCEIFQDSNGNYNIYNTLLAENEGYSKCATCH